MILAGPVGNKRVGANTVDSRLVGWQDIMPTLLDLCDIPIPDSVEGISMVGEKRRELLYGEEAEGARANRMMHDGRHKLIYYPAGNVFQLFDLAEDPDEVHDLSGDPAYQDIRDHLTTALIGNLYGGDREWIKDGSLVGMPEPEYRYRPVPGLFGQRGSHWSPPPASGREIKDLDLI